MRFRQEEKELLISLCFKKNKKNVELVSNEDAVKVEANQRRKGQVLGKCTAQGRGEFEGTDGQAGCCSASSGGLWEAGRVNIIKLYIELGLENTGTCW